MSEDVVIIGGARTPFCEWVGGKRGDGKTGGALKTLSAQNLGGIALKQPSSEQERLLNP